MECGRAARNRTGVRCADIFGEVALKGRHLGALGYPTRKNDAPRGSGFFFTQPRPRDRNYAPIHRRDSCVSPNYELLRSPAGVPVTRRAPSTTVAAGIDRPPARWLAEIPRPLGPVH